MTLFIFPSFYLLFALILSIFLLSSLNFAATESRKKSQKKYIIGVDKGSHIDFNIKTTKKGELNIQHCLSAL